jgi:heptosyltransferase I
MRRPSLAPGGHARVCVVMMTAVGDAVHVLPIVNAIKRHAPHTRITWVLQPGPAALVRGHASVDEILLFERERGWRGFAAIRAELATQRFDLVLALQDYFKAGIVTSFAKAPVKVGLDRTRGREFNWLFTTHRIPARPRQHVQDQYFEFLEYLGVPQEPVIWNLGPWPDERPWQGEFFSTFDRPAAAIVVGTSNPEKEWRPERWASVADALRHDFDLEPVIVGGRSQRELQAELVLSSTMRKPPRSALGSGLRRLVAILSGSALVISPDTGPLHMSVALGRPVISLMGYTNPKRTGPYRRFHDLIVDAYGDPGETYTAAAGTRRGRMARISVRDVLEKVELWRARYAAGSGPSPAAWHSSGPYGV